MLLNDLLSQTRLVTVAYGDSELNVEYYRQRLTDCEGQRLVAALQASSGHSDQSFVLACEFLVRIIAWWDLYESEGIPLAITAETLCKLPISAVADVFMAIMRNESNPQSKTEVESDV